MLETLETLFLIFVSGYFIQSVIFFIGAAKKFPQKSDDELPTATVIVAARNEEQNVLRCLISLDKLIYPDGKLSIILVDDKSTDKTGNIIDDFIQGKQKFQKIVTKKEIGKLKGKTNALANALELATGEIILTTDADCEVNPNWAKTLASYYEKDVAVVNGFTSQKAVSGFSGMQAIDFVYLLFVASGTINLGHPLSCIGNNMSYRRSAYFEVGGYENLPFSVTEDFNLLISIYRLKKYKIIFPLNVNSLVVSLACKDFRTLYRQKKRWGVGGLQIPAKGYIVFFFGYFTQLGMLALPFLFTPVWLYLVAFKLFIDFFVLYIIHDNLGIKKNLLYFFHFEFYYTLYVLLLPFMITISRKVIWKDRKY